MEGAGESRRQPTGHQPPPGRGAAGPLWRWRQRALIKEWRLAGAGRDPWTQRPAPSHRLPLTVLHLLARAALSKHLAEVPF